MCYLDLTWVYHSQLSLSFGFVFEILYHLCLLVVTLKLDTKGHASNTIASYASVDF